MRKFLFVGTALAVFAGGCTTTDIASSAPGAAAPAPIHALAGTKWRLVHFESSDDAIGTVIPPNAENYTLEFMADGSLAMGLDCNRGTATWRVAEQTGTGGMIAISPGAMTRAMCQPGAIDTQLAADMARVRSFTMAEGRLHLALEADGGIYAWAPFSTS